MKPDFPDWFHILAELRTVAGMNLSDVAKAIGVPHSTVKKWYYRRGRPSEPLYSNGAALLRLYAEKVQTVPDSSRPISR